VERRSAEIVSPHLKALRVSRHSFHLMEKFASLAHSMRARVGSQKPVSSKLQRRLFRAGLYQSNSVDAYIGIRVILPLALVAVTSFLSTNFIVLVGVGLAGFLLPDFFLQRMGKKRLVRIRVALPDTVDLLVTCMDAGLGMDQALQRTAEVLHIAYPDLCSELVFLGHLQSLGMENTKAWQQLVDRTKSPDLDQVSKMLSQSERFGTPISDAMRALADSLRMKRKQTAEEHAAKSGVILLIPLVLFIFPVIFVILLGPAAISIMHGFAPLMHHSQF
jgi:tight adherence protein C